MRHDGTPRRRILITGASSGLGAEMARQFAARGRDLALCARRVDRLEALRDELRADHPDRTVVVRALDVDDHDAVFRVFGECAEQLGGLDRVIVNAGIGKGVRVGTGGFCVNRHTIETDLVSALAQCEAALEQFRPANRGHLVVISSVSALRGMPGTMTAYSAAKAGLSALAEGIRLELARTPIRVTTVLPGYIASEMNGSVAQRTPLVADIRRGVGAMVGAIEREAGSAVVPAWPWVPLAFALRHAPGSLVRRFA